MNNRILRLAQVMYQTGVSRSTIYLWMEKNKFPKQVCLGERMVGWLDYEVDEWLSERVELSRKPNDN